MLLLVTGGGQEFTSSLQNAVGFLFIFGVHVCGRGDVWTFLAF